MAGPRRRAARGRPPSPRCLRAPVPGGRRDRDRDRRLRDHGSGPGRHRRPLDPQRHPRLVPARRPPPGRSGCRPLRRPRPPHAPGSVPVTDPLALDPVLPPRERSERSARRWNEDLPHDERYEHFEAHVLGGGKIEPNDWMPDEYRSAVLRFVEMHANSELMGVLPEREWIMRAPTLRRKLALTSKVQDEVSHAQLLSRVAEDLGKPREAMFDDLLAGKTKFHNVFHYPTRTWADIGVIAWLVDAAAI